MHNPATTETAARLAIIVGRFNRRLRSATGGLSHGLLSALASVTKHGPIRLADLAQLEQISAPSITRMVAELETRGLVARTTDPADGRAALIEVTRAGTDAVLLARSARAEVASELLMTLDGDEIATIDAALPALERMIGQV
ncbi:MAG: MarR family transcriptional regulator [Microbacteriaceae bacterium]|nr:MarR family transcriptional regulator [Microbacteriaceae bacterium]